MMNGRIKKLELIALICATGVLFGPEVYAEDLVPENTDRIVLPYLENPSNSRADQNRDLNFALEFRNEKNNYFNIHGLPPEFSEDEPKKVSIGAIFKLAIDEFDFLSGVKKRVDDAKK